MQTSLRQSLTRAFAAPALATLLAGSWLAYQVAEDVVSRAYDQNLLNLASGVANRVHIDGDKVRLVLPFEAEAVLRTDTMDKIYFRVRDASGHIIAGDADLPPPEIQEQDTRPRFYEATYKGQLIRGVRLHPLQDNADFYVTVAETQGKRRKAINELLLGFGMAVFLVLTAVAVVVRIGLPSGLEPLHRLQRELAARSGHDLSPIGLSGVPIEISEVVQALNAMLGRLRDANSAQRQFLQDAAHQLRTPLAGLRVQLELVRAGTPDTAAVDRLQQSVLRITRLTNQLLALARAEAGDRLMADASPVRLGDLIDDMVEDWLRIADEKRIDFGVQRDPAVITGDPTLLRELIANLVDNALKYTPTGGQVTLHCTRGADAVEIGVTDNGPGIPPDQREEVFERFTRLPAATASGSGLGLSIAREIVRAHGGAIWVETGPGGIGTSLRVRLPVDA
jgi:two-component system sensor histidine kinase TctE